MENKCDSFGQFFKEKRLSLGISLRCFCLKHGLDPANISRIERGLSAPPQSREKLEEYASYLGITSDTDDWYTFFDYASTSFGRIPHYILNDEELVQKLPFVFRAFRNSRLSENDLKKFAEDLRRV